MQLIKHRFDYDRISQWLLKCPHSNILQTAAYAFTVRDIDKLTSVLYAIMDGDKQIGFFIAQHTAFLCDRFGVFIIDRGPLWFEGENIDDNHRRFITALHKHFPPRLFRPRRFTPEIENTETIKKYMLESGWKHNKGTPDYHSRWLDIDNDDETLMNGMQGKWRNALRKNLKAATAPHIDDRGETVMEFITLYEKDKLEKGYNGPSPQMMKTLLDYAFADQSAIIVHQYDGETLLGMAAFVMHGTCATYQTAFQTQQGRDVNSTYGLIWHAIGAMRERGITQLDLGGMNEDHAGGVSHFKKGIGGLDYHLIGQYH